MMRCLRFVGITFAVCALAGLARAGEPTPEQIIERALRAHGGEDRLNQLTAFHLKERMVYEKGPVLSFEVITDLPQRYRSQARNGTEGKNFSTIVFDGDQAWMKMGDAAAEPYYPSGVKMMRTN
jgi:hypothetical protein